MNLTRNTLFTSLFILFSNLVFTQSSIGLKAGINLVDWDYRYDGDDISELNSVDQGYQFGAAIDFRLSQKLSLLTEFWYIKKGQRFLSQRNLSHLVMNLVSSFSTTKYQS